MKPLYLAAAGALATLAQPALAGTAVVNAQSDIYKGAGADGSDGLAPLVIDLGNATSITFSVTGSVSVNSLGNINDPDGVGSAQGETNSGFGLFSGIQAPTAGFLAGVFVSSAQRLNAPAALNFTSSGLGTNFASLSPLNSQVFFIGDGRTSAGVTQTFNIPTAGRGHQLLLGLTDACGYSGSPGCYGDNSGSFVVNYTLNGPVSGAVPEPASWGLMILGFGAMGFALRRRAKVRTNVGFA